MRLTIFLAAICMSASWAMTWLDPPFAGAAVSPMAMVADGRIMLGRDSSWQALIFLCGFASAGLAGLSALGGRRGGAGVLAICAGIVPVILLADAVIAGDMLRDDLGLPFPVALGDVQASWHLLRDFLRIGFWAYLAGAALLVVAGIGAVMRR